VWVHISGIPLYVDGNTIAAHKNPRKQAGLGDVHISLLYMTCFTPGGGSCREGAPPPLLFVRTKRRSNSKDIDRTLVHGEKTDSLIVRTHMEQ